MNRKPNLELVDHGLSIDAPISRVFDFLANHENYALWFPNVLSIVSDDSLPHGTVGKVYKEAIRLPGGRNGIIAITVVQSRTPDLFATEGDLAVLHPRMEVHLSSESAGETFVRWRFFSRSQSTIGRVAIRLLFRKRLQRDSATGLARMKAIVEALN